MARLHPTPPLDVCSLACYCLPMRRQPSPTREERIAKYPTPADYTLPISPRIDSSLGYEYFCDIWHPLGSKIGRVWYHRHVASVAIGRWLAGDEVAHHKDHVKNNNSSNNVTVKDQIAHLKDHQIEMGNGVRNVIACAWCKEMFMQGYSSQKYDTMTCHAQALAGTEWPSDEDLQAYLLARPATEVAKELGISSSAIKTRCQLRGIETRPRGYWRKHRLDSGRWK